MTVVSPSPPTTGQQYKDELSLEWWTVSTRTTGQHEGEHLTSLLSPLSSPVTQIITTSQWPSTFISYLTSQQDPQLLSLSEI